MLNIITEKQSINNCYRIIVNGQRLSVLFSDKKNAEHFIKGVREILRGLTNE